MKRDESIIIMYSLLKTAVEQTEHWVAMTTTRTAKPKELDLLPVPIWFGFGSYLFIYFSVLCLNLRFCFHPTSWPVMMWLPIALSNCNPFILRSVILSFCLSMCLVRKSKSWLELLLARWFDRCPAKKSEFV
jgi:uncharacterized membrane protein